MSESGSVSLDIASIGEEVKLLEGIRTTRGMRRLKADPVPVELNNWGRSKIYIFITWLGAKG